MQSCESDGIEVGTMTSVGGACQQLGEASPANALSPSPLGISDAGMQALWVRFPPPRGNEGAPGTPARTGKGRVF